MSVTRDSQGTELWNYITIFVNPELNKLHIYGYSSFKSALSKPGFVHVVSVDRKSTLMSWPCVLQCWMNG